MRQVLASSLFISFAAYLPLAIAQGTDPEPGSTDDSPPPGWPEKLELPEEPAGLRASAGGLPSPSLTEPFTIGEALYDPARVDVAVISLLNVMGVGVDTANGTPSTAGTAAFRFSEAEVRLMIEMARVDAEVASKKGRPPYSFRDLHRAVAPLLPDVSVEHLAASYAEAYQNHYEALVPLVMLGQPIEPGTRLTRLQIWLLLVDGFVPPDQLNPSSGWGTASTVLQPLPPPVAGWSNASWRDLLARLAVLAARMPIEIALQPDLVHEGHGGPGTKVSLEARLGAPAAQSTTAFPGQLLLTPATGVLADRQVNWHTDHPEVFERHGELVPALEPGRETPTNTDATGVARISYQPKAEAANGRGAFSEETVEIAAAIDQWDLVSARYALPPPLRDFVIGDIAARREVDIGWHVFEPPIANATSNANPNTNASPNSNLNTNASATPSANASAIERIDISIANTYNVTLDMGFLGGGTRSGYDMVEGTLTLQPDGRYRGIVSGYASGTQELSGLGQSCALAESEGWQELEVIGTPIGGFGPTHQAPTGAAAAHPLTRRLSALPSYNWISGQPNGGFLSLEFFPTTSGRYSKRDPCQTEMQQVDDPGKPWFLPYNDSQWTIQHAGYGIALPDSGTLRYYDNTSATTIVGTSIWYIVVDRIR